MTVNSKGTNTANLGASFWTLCLSLKSGAVGQDPQEAAAIEHPPLSSKGVVVQGRKGRGYRLRRSVGLIAHDYLEPSLGFLFGSAGVGQRDAFSTILLSCEIFLLDVSRAQGLNEKRREKARTRLGNTLRIAPS